MYTAISIDVFIAAYSGALGGWTNKQRHIVKIPGFYERLCLQALAFAEQFDTQYASVMPNELQLSNIESTVSEYWNDYNPPGGPDAVTASKYASSVQNIIDILTESDAIVAANVTNPIPVPVPVALSVLEISFVAGISDSLTSIIPTTAIAAVVDGWGVKGDGGGGTFFWNPASTATDDGGTIINPIGNPGAGRWIRIYAGPVFVTWFGADSTGVADSTASFTNALTINGHEEIRVPQGTYKISSALEIGPNQALIGDGQSVTTLDFTGLGDCISDDVRGPANFAKVIDLTISNSNVLNVGSGVAIDSAYYMTIQRVTVTAFGSHGFRIMGGTNGPNVAFMRMLQIRSTLNAGSGIYLADQAGANNFFVEGWTELTGNGRYGFEQPIIPTLANQSVIHLDGIGFQANTLGGLNAQLLRGSSIRNCYFENSTNGTQIAISLGEGSDVGPPLVHGSCTGITIEACQFSSTKAQYAISAMGVTGSPDWRISGNRFDGTAGFGIAAINMLLHQDWDIQGNNLATGWAPVVVASSIAGGLGDNLWTNTNTQRKGHLKPGAAFADLLRLYNSVAAVLGTQAWSPALTLGGNCWTTGGGGASQAVDIGIVAIPVQGATAHVRLSLETQVNGGGYVQQAYVDEAGLLVPRTAFVLPGANPAQSGVIRAPNNINVITVRNSTNTGDYGILTTDNSDITYLLGNDGLRYFTVDSTADQNRSVATTWQDLSASGAIKLQTDLTIADGSTALLIRRNVGGSFSLQRVSMGAADSGGAGFKVLRVPN